MRGRRHSGKWLVVSVLANRMDHDRLGLVVARRLVQTAVARNAVKRTIREAFRTRGAVQRGGGRDIVVQLRARPDDSQALRAELAGLLTKVDAAPSPP